MSGDSTVLVLNAGSSSLKYSLVDATSGKAFGSGLVERIGEGSGSLHHEGPAGRHEEDRSVDSHEDALRLALQAFEEHGPSLDDAGLIAVGHRVVHGGDRFSEPALVDDGLLATVEELVPLAPLHNPANLEGMRVALRLFPDVPHVAVFDTAFHQTLPPHAYTYAVPREWAEEHHIRRYGFHGTSVSFVVGRAAEMLGKPVEECRFVVMHLGNGASVTAVDGGCSVETSMGFTPLEGLVMGTRSGDVDPALPGHLNRHLGWDVVDVDRALNRDSGLKGLCGSNDFRTLLQKRAEGDEGADLAFDVYCHRLRKYVGSYYAVLGTVDALVFTGGVGEKSPEVRAAALAGLERLGIEVDEERNAAQSSAARDVATDDAEVRVLVVPTDEEWEIARQAAALAR
ncbi:acetate/propionate family kinase [Nocardioides caldifontis]|uniref:acetate/propionate family kinase n=1 Tax=Nocardioides caldifontis TaxID=2588938 RepID=UPI0011E048BC|nr:acetate kinase [Nocardioides caldifontis]